MTARQVLGMGGVVGVCVVTVLAAALSIAPRVQARDDDRGRNESHDDDRDNEESQIRRGFDIAPVPLNLAHKNRALVGLGSYIVNAKGECNGCHSAGPQTQFLLGGNPYFGERERTNPATYLGGGRDFGPYPSPASPIHIISRNLTPDHTGLPIGGDTFQEFRHTIRTGVDPDLLHPDLPLPFNGTLLQIMPWPAYREMTDHDLRAIYEYLSAIPCVAGPDHVC